MHPHRSSALGYASAASAAHSRVYGACAAEAAASESSGLSVGGCIRARRYFGPHPVENTRNEINRRIATITVNDQSHAGNKLPTSLSDGESVG